MVTSDEHAFRRRRGFAGGLSEDPSATENHPQMGFGLGNGVSFQFLALPRKTAVLETRTTTCQNTVTVPSSLHLVQVVLVLGPVCPILEVVVRLSAGRVARAFCHMSAQTL